MKMLSHALIPALFLTILGDLPGAPDSCAGRAARIAEMLPESPCGIGPGISDRQAWGRFEGKSSAGPLIKEAFKLAETPIVAPTDELFLEYSRMGNRTRYEALAGKLHGRIVTFTLAECVRNNGDFIAPLEKAIHAVCAQKSWVSPAHDWALTNFNGTEITVDLVSSRTAWNLALADHLLGDRLSDGTRSMIRSEVGRRVLDPYEKSLAGGKHRNFWITHGNNWNAVCHAGTIGAALILEPDRARRARFVEAAEKNIRFFLNGFSADGYCSEGLGYWNYGFGHFVLLAETLRQATGGHLDFLKLDGVRKPALHPADLEIVDGVYAAFADCPVNVRPDQRLVKYIGCRLASPAAVESGAPELIIGHTLAETLVYTFPEPWRGARLPDSDQPHEPSPTRGWFPDAGILVCRMPQGVEGTFGVALKGGHNDEHHNHNDLGSYAVVVGDRPVLLDPGSEVYTGRTFSSRRYESKVLSSYGHPVPVVAGELQRTGRAAAARMLETTFNPGYDALLLDLSSAYQVPGLRRLERSFRFERQGSGVFTVKDIVEFTEPATFETALIAAGDWREEAPGRLLVRDGDSAVRIRIDSGGLPFTVRGERIDEDVRMPSKPLRIGISLKEPVLTATIRVSIVPVSVPAADCS